jgi:hypothetical protein
MRSCKHGVLNKSTIQGSKQLQMLLHGPQHKHTSSQQLLLPCAALHQNGLHLVLEHYVYVISKHMGMNVHVQVLPALREHRDEVLLRELLNRWNNHKVMVRWLSRFFNYLDRYELLLRFGSMLPQQQASKQ